MVLGSRSHTRGTVEAEIVDDKIDPEQLQDDAPQERDDQRALD